MQPAYYLLVLAYADYYARHCAISKSQPYPFYAWVVIKPKPGTPWFELSNSSYCY